MSYYVFATVMILMIGVPQNLGCGKWILCPNLQPVNYHSTNVFSDSNCNTMHHIKMVLIVILSVMTAETQGLPPDSFLVTAQTPFLLMYVVWSQVQGQDHY